MHKSILILLQILWFVLVFVCRFCVNTAFTFFNFCSYITLFKSLIFNTVVSNPAGLYVYRNMMRKSNIRLRRVEHHIFDLIFFKHATSLRSFEFHFEVIFFKVGVSSLPITLRRMEFYPFNLAFELRLFILFLYPRVAFS
jgi:hypothetical protein